VNVSGIAVTGSSAANYSFNSVPLTTTANITAASTLSQVTSTLNPALPGSNITFTCTLASAGSSTDKPSGTVTFKDGAVTLGASAVDGSGSATLSTSLLSHGSHVITAEYAGDLNYLGRTNSLSPNQVVNTPPATGTFALGTTINTPVSFAASKLMKVDTDSDHDTLSVMGVNGASAHGGTISWVGSTITYAPPSNYVGADSFNYTVTDPYNGTATGTVSVTVRLGNFSSVISNLEPQADGNMRIIASGIPGGTYLIQATADLSTWGTIATNVALTNGLITYVDLNATNYTSRYYRIAAP